MYGFAGEVASAGTRPLVELDPRSSESAEGSHHYTNEAEPVRKFPNEVTTHVKFKFEQLR